MFAALAAMAAAAPAHAVHFLGSYAITAHGEGDGLLIETTALQPGTPPELSFDLDQGQSLAIPLFSIFTEESWVNSDDKEPREIAVDFTFTAPDAFGGSIGGETRGRSIFYGLIQWGELKWDSSQNPRLLDFGNGGQLEIALNDVTFSKGLFGLNGLPLAGFDDDDDDDGHFHYDGCGHAYERYGGTVTGLFTLNQVSAVPEPATWAFMIVGFGAVGAVIRASARTRRRRSLSV